MTQRCACIQVPTDMLERLLKFDSVILGTDREHLTTVEISRIEMAAGKPGIVECVVSGPACPETRLGEAIPLYDVHAASATTVRIMPAETEMTQRIQLDARRLMAKAGRHNALEGRQIRLRVGKVLRIPMRDCDDVPRYLERMEKAHRQTAQSTLHFP